MKIEKLRIEEIIPYVNNPKEHPEKQIQLLMSSIKEYGYVNPIIVDKDNVIIAGHGRYEALKRLGFTEIPVIRVEHLTPEQIKAYRIADNRIAEIGIWDEELLRVEISQILDEIKDLGLVTGFSETEIERLLEVIEEFEPDDKDNTQPAQALSLTQSGDIWELGPHRLICGDSTKWETYEQLLQGEKVNLVVTSPPYAEQRKDEYGGISPEDYPDWFCQIADCIWMVLEDDGSFFINIIEHAEGGQKSLYFYETLFKLKERGWKYIDRFIWKKSNPIPGNFTNRLKNGYEDIHWIGKKDYATYYISMVDVEDEPDTLSVYLHNDYEEIFHVAKRVKIKFRPRAVGKKGTTFTARGENKSKNKNVGIGKTRQIKRKGIVRPSNVLEIPPNQETWGHPAMFPVELPAFFIRLTTEEGDKVLEPFTGSGTTLVACDKLNRKFYGVEYKPEYCDIVISRYIQLKGSHKDIYLVRDGERVPYEEVAQ